jgi:hypothetical protein
VGPIEYVSTTLLAAGIITLELLPGAKEPGWARPVFFDGAARDAFHAESSRGRAVADAASDVLAAAGYALPLLVDPWIVAPAREGDVDVGWQLFVIGAQSVALTHAVNLAAKRAFARERPYLTGCAEDPNYSHLCTAPDRYRSFFSGHSAATATGAGLVCAHHTHLELYGGGAPDSAACAAAVTGSLLTGVLRVIADRHWLSDVAVGHVVGFATGYLLPSGIYYGGFRSSPGASAPISLLPHAPGPRELFRFGGAF